MQVSPSIALVTTSTRLAGLLVKYGTKGAAKFRLSTARAHFAAESPQSVSTIEAASDFEQYVDEDDRFRRAVDQVESAIDGLGISVINLVVPNTA